VPTKTNLSKKYKINKNRWQQKLQKIIFRANCALLPTKPLTPASPLLQVLTRDSVTVSVDAVVYYRVSNATVSVANVENAHHSTRLLAQTTLRNILVPILRKLDIGRNVFGLIFTLDFGRNVFGLIFTLDFGRNVFGQIVTPLIFGQMFIQKHEKCLSDHFVLNSSGFTAQNGYDKQCLLA
jgi:hypothetical protein